ncbi:MAG TPA: hypothetical protein VFZ09_03045 [Archangium sp.]|uniref:hypothetical protein n=1 Tax=Archangium sp. TaxID=1872627 RepID=UPI002E35F6B8|nr:hypothetical protein [Archangium sp.]HEX5745191.1 hypothetical protein [Archangium sp.]
MEKSPGAAAAPGLTALWLSLEPDQFDDEGFGTPQLGAGCLEAAEILGIQLPPRPLPSRRAWFKESQERFADFRSHRRSLAWPRVFAPVVNAAPVRVFHAVLPGAPREEDDAIRETASLVQRFLGVATPSWALEGDAPGPSKMAALFVRALLERWPEAGGVLASGAPGGLGELLDLGITGALDARGLAVPVGGLEDKVRSFFTRCPEGRLFVPASQWRQARAYLDQRYPPEKEGSSDEQSMRGWRLQPFRSVLELLIRLGLSTPALPDTQLFEKLRQASQRIPLWNRDMRAVSETLELQLVRHGERPRTRGATPGVREAELLGEIREHTLCERSRTAYIEGGPGSGKSIVLRRLNARLYQEDKLLGPAFRIEARPLVRAGLSLDVALHGALKSWLRLEECQRLLELAWSPELAGSVWLLIDGLDEVPGDERGAIREFISRWPGPSILGSRPLPNEVSGSPHVRVQPLDEFQQKQLFEMEGKPGHLDVLTGKQALRTRDRRKEMVADLCSTPLGVSLLAMLSEEELGERLDVPAVLERCIARLIERAQSAGRISKSTRLTVLSQGGLGILGAAAWSMIRRGDGTLTLEDLAAMKGPKETRDAVYEVLEDSDFVQRAGPDLYQFSHKSFAEFCAAYHLIGQPAAEEELLALVGEPGAEAVAFHFGARLSETGRLTRFIQRLTNNPRRPMSSLALATRLLVANGPDRVEVGAALETLGRRLRVVSHFDTPKGHGLLLPGELEEDGELWLALERWGGALRPHADALIAVCPPAVGRFLRGELPPLRYVHENFYQRQSDEHAAASLAEELATRLGLEPPLPVLIRFGCAESLLLARPPGPWLLELESLFEAPQDEARDDVAFKATSVWARRASERHLEYLEALSRCIPAAVAPVLETVRRQGTWEQKREALLRAALNSLELGETDKEGDWMARVRFARQATGIPAERWLAQWELLWTCGLVGDTSPRSKLLEPLYAEFIDDACGPARWRALIARANLQGSVDVELLHKSLHDGFRAVRIAAIRQLVRQGEALGVDDVRLALVSLDDHERWVAFEAIGAGKTAPIELLLAVLTREKPPRPEPQRYEAWLPTETPWELAVSEGGEEARRHLLQEVVQRVRERPWPQALLAMLDGPYASVAEEVFPTSSMDAPLMRTLLEGGSPSQRRFAVRHLPWGEEELLAPYVEDADPEIAKRARELLERKHKSMRSQSESDIHRSEERERDKKQRARETRSLLSLDRVARTGSFEELWGLLPLHRLPLYSESQKAYFADEKKLRAEGEGRWPVESISDRQRKPILQRLRELYRPHLQALLLEGLKDEDLKPFSISLLRDNPSGEEVLSLIPAGGESLESAVRILGGTSQSSTAAQRLRELLLSGRLRPKPVKGEPWHDPVAQARHEKERFQGDACLQLASLDGVMGLLPLLEPDVPKDWRTRALNHLSVMLCHWERPPARGHEALDWARRGAVNAGDEVLREQAFRLLAFFGDAEDAARWRPALEQRELPPRHLAAVIRLVARFGVESELPVFRSLLEHSTEAGTEAGIALARVGGASVVEELVQLLESPPSTLRSECHPLEVPRWHSAAAETVIRFGDGPQAKRCARVLARDHGVWHVAARHLRLPEHLLFFAEHVGSKDPGADHDDGYDDAERLLKRMIARVGAGPAHRVMLEACLWGHPFRSAFEDFVEEKLQASDGELLLERLREQPDHGLILLWLKQLSVEEELIDAVWREKAVPWWLPVPASDSAPPA